MSTRHCRHCADDCIGGDPIPAWPRPEMHSDSLEDAQWYDCPACAEAERVAEVLIDGLNAMAERIASLRPAPTRGDR